MFPAPLNNPALAAMIPMVTPSDPGGFRPQCRGGISFGALEWAMVVAGRTNRALPDGEPEFIPAYRTPPLDSVDVRMGRRSPVWQRYLANLDNPAFWKPRSYQPDLPRSRAPMLHLTGWCDGTLGGSLENFAAMRRRAAPETRAAQYLLVGPWRHWIDEDARASVIGGRDFGAEAVVETRPIYRAWFDRFLKRRPDAIAGWRRVRLFVLGENRWLGADDYRPVEARRDVLVYPTPPAPAGRLVVCGPIRASIVASSSARDTDWVARLSLVHPNGDSQRLTEGWVRARARRGEFRNDPLVPGRAERYELDLWGTCVAVGPGQRLRLAIMSAAFPLLAPNLDTGGPLATERTPVVARQAIFHGPGQQSFVTLPIVDAPAWISRP